MNPLLAATVLAVATSAIATPATADPTIDFSPMAVGGYDAEVGHLEVSEYRGDPNARTIRLAVMRLKSTAAEPGPPLVLLPGGPGNGATGLARSPIWTPLLELGDVILMDPRGVGRSEPNLIWNSEAIRPEKLFADETTATNHMRDLCTQASAELRANDIDLRGYTTIELADDINDLRRALDVPQINLIGHSYGTHLGLSILDRHPGTVARFVAVGTAGTGDMMKLPSDLDRSLATLSAAVAADPSVGPAMPDFAGSLARAVSALDAEPLPVPITDPKTGETREVMLHGFGLRLLLLADIGDTADLPYFPRLIHSIERRDPSIVRGYLEKRMRQFSQLPMMMFTVRAASGATTERWSRIRSEALNSPFGMARCLFSPSIDAPIGVNDVGDAFRQPVRSDVPTLFISGSLDANTPAFQAERVRAGFANAGHLVVDQGGHEDLIPDRTVQARIRAFLAGGDPQDEVLPRPALRFQPLTAPTVDAQP